MFCISLKHGLNTPPLESDRLRARLNEIINMSDSVNSRGFGNVIRSSAFCDCSDPKDRIYAILSLLDQADKSIKIEPDYTKTTGQVYEVLVLRYVENLNLLDLLRHCDLRNDTSAEMPTWVPDWAVANMAEPMAGDGKANGHSVAEVVHKGGGALDVTGVISATITNAQVTLFQENNYITVINEIRRLAPINFENRTYVSDGSLLDDLTSTFCANTFSITSRLDRLLRAGHGSNRAGTSYGQYFGSRLNPGADESIPRFRPDVC